MRVERTDRRGHRFGKAEEANGDLGDHPKRAFRADEQSRQVVAGRRLSRAAAGVNDAAVGEHDRQAEDGFAHRAVAHRGRARCARRGHAADRRIGARIDPERQSCVVQCLVQLTMGDARFDRRVEIVGIDLQDAIHPREIDRHATAEAR